MHTKEKIEGILNEKVRPVLALHHGNLTVTGLKRNVLQVRMSGACNGCPAATLTVQSLVAAEIQSALPIVKKVEIESGVSDSLIQQARQLMSYRKTR